MKRVTIEMSETQARIVLTAVEEWFRLRMGQYNELANDLAFLGFDHDKAMKGEFDMRIVKRNAITHILRAVCAIAFPDYGIPIENEPEVNIASDIWSQLRYELNPKEEWGYKPFQMGREPMVKVTVEEVNK